MMAIAVRYVITSPATSRLMRDALQEAIDRGDRTVCITAIDPSSEEVIELEFLLERNSYNRFGVEYSGQLTDRGFATINAFTHPDMTDESATLTLIRRDTP